MSEIKLVLRDENRNVSLICHGSDAHRAVAALSADPVTIEELEAALRRFMNVEPGEFLGGAGKYLDDQPWDSGLVVIDLTAQLIVVDSTYFDTRHSGRVRYRNDNEATDIELGYSLSDGWQISHERMNWHQLADARRQ